MDEHCSLHYKWSLFFKKTQVEEEKEDENSTQYTLETTEEAQSSY